MTAALLESIFGLGCLVSSVVFMVVTMRAIDKRCRADEDFQEWVENFLRTMSDNRRAAERHILRHLKGEDYQDTFGDFEIYTDPQLPPPTSVILPPKKKKGNWW